MNLAALTRRQREVLAYIVLGWNDKEIARAINVKPETVQNFCDRIRDRLGVGSRYRLIARYYLEGHHVAAESLAQHSGEGRVATDPESHRRFARSAPRAQVPAHAGVSQGHPVSDSGCESECDKKPGLMRRQALWETV